MKVIGTRWFTEMGNPATIGIVLVRLDQKEMQEFDREFPEAAFIGTVTGLGIEQDIDKIVRGGARFPLAAAKLIIDGD